MSCLSDQDTQEVSLLAYDQYIRFVKWTPRLGEGEEAQLLHCILLGQREQVKCCPERRMLTEAKQARDRLVEAYQPLVVSIARRYVKVARSMEVLDLAQEGTIGLLQAIDQFDAEHGSTFAAFAGVYIRSCILAALRDRDGFVRDSKYTQEMVSCIRRVGVRLASTLGRSASLDEVAQEMGTPTHKVREFLELAHRGQEVLSLHELLREGEAEDVLAFVSVFETCMERETTRQHELEQAVQHAISTVLTARQREAIRLRYGFDGPAHSLGETAQALGVKRASSVCGLERYAEQRLRSVLHPLYHPTHEERSA